jgi:transposase
MFLVRKETMIWETKAIAKLSNTGVEHSRKLVKETKKINLLKKIKYTAYYLHNSSSGSFE